jgi:hypothetical protein
MCGKKASPLKRLGIRFAVVLISTVLSLFLLEGAVRFLSSILQSEDRSLFFLARGGNIPWPKKIQQSIKEHRRGISMW